MSLRLAKFLADENINTKVIDFLRKDGFDIKSVFELNLGGKEDNEILSVALKEDRIVITHDTDFAHIIFTKKLPFKAIIYLQPGHINPDYSILTVQKIFSSDLELIEPFILVAEYKEGIIKLRVRNAILL